MKLSDRKKLTIKDFPTKEVAVKVHDCSPIEVEPGIKQGLATFTAFNTDVFDENEEQIGSIGGGIGFVVINVHDGPYYMIRHDDLWEAVTGGGK